MHAKSKHHNLLLTIGALVALAGVIFALWQWQQFPHEAFPIDDTTVSIPRDTVKKPRPAMPTTNTDTQP